MLAQHRRELDVEVVERGDSIDGVLARDCIDAPPDLRVGRLASDAVDVVNGVTRPRRADERIRCEKQHAASLPAAFTQKGFALEIGGDAQNRQHLYFREPRDCCR